MLSEELVNLHNTVNNLKKDLNAKKLIKEAEYTYIDRVEDLSGAGNSFDRHYETYTEKVEISPAVYEADREKRDKAKKELEKIYQDTEWLSVKYNIMTALEPDTEKLARDLTNAIGQDQTGFERSYHDLLYFFRMYNINKFMDLTGKYLPAMLTDIDSPVKDLKIPEEELFRLIESFKYTRDKNKKRMIGSLVNYSFLKIFFRVNPFLFTIFMILLPAILVFMLAFIVL